MKIGLVGVGELGFAIGANMLEAGHELLVYDVRPQGIEEIMTRGALATSSAAEAAAAVQVVMTALPTPEIIDDVLLGSGGVLDAMQPGSVWIDHSTTDRDLLMKIEKQAREKDVDVIEAPVTGGIPLAHAGCITVLVGATASAFVRSRALLDVVGQPVIHVGPVGSASIVKVMTNMLAFVHLWALNEGLMFATAAGLETGAVYEAIKHSCGNSFVAETEGVPIMAGSFDYGFTMELALKDMKLVEKIAAENNVPLLMGGLATQILQRGIARYGAQAWSTGIGRLLEDELGIELRAPGYETEHRWAGCD
ncbi:MAG: NAD(P)-dependent oxidoreductase [Anaerolineales bacterium]|nr:NAD(P)-dependent oxidoreductase [Anaerolineales bacterium]